MNYQIIRDKNQLLEFIDWLPELEPHEKFYICLMGRNKYLENRSILKTDKCAIKRFLADKRYLFDKIRQLEVEVGCYKFDGKEIPEQALALYITINPRDLIQATKNGLKKFADLITEKKYNGYNPVSEILSQTQQACTNKVYYIIDYDGQGILSLKSEIENIVDPKHVTYLKTRGGFHLLVDLDKISKSGNKLWYQKLTTLPGADVRGIDCLSPIPGCIQGGFTPYIAW